MSSIQRTARVAGLLYLVFGLLAAYGMPSYFISPGGVVTTANTLIASESLFRLSILISLLARLLNIFVVFALYRLLKPVNKNMALLMVLFVLLVVPIELLNELNRYAALLLLKGTGLTAFTAVQLQALAPFFLELHRHGITIAGLFWGLWLFPMGYLVFKSGYLPRILGILLMIACFGYLINSFIIFLALAYPVNVVIFIGWIEIVFPLWLLIRGVNMGQWQKHTVEPAL